VLARKRPRNGKNASESLTSWGQALCPALDALLKWAALHDVTVAPASPGVPETDNDEARERDEKRAVTRQRRVRATPVS
jgi:DNA-binding HxlR family transcriptional regulator